LFEAEDQKPESISAVLSHYGATKETTKGVKIKPKPDLYDI
jgi:hypothetical protein